MGDPVATTWKLNECPTVALVELALVIAGFVPTTCEIDALLPVKFESFAYEAAIV